MTFSGRIRPSEPAAPQLMQPGAPYKPSLQTNYPDNAPEGDMLVGTYGQNTVDPPDGAADEGTIGTDISGNPYHRRDFQNTSNQAFLVRMRRTVNSGNPGYNTSSNTSGLDQEAGISSSGPTLPVLFGRGSMMAPSGNAGQLSAASGITVRATAIAAAGTVTFPTSSGTLTYTAGRALTVGQPYNGIDVNNNPVNIPGSLSAMVTSTGGTGSQLYYVVIYLSQWKLFSTTLQTTLVAGANLMVMEGTTTCGYVTNGSALGAQRRLHDRPGDADTCDAGGPWLVGEQVGIRVCAPASHTYPLWKTIRGPVPR